MKIYIIFRNNEEEYEDYDEWIEEVYESKERAEKRFIELVKTNQYKRDRMIKKAKYDENIGAYRLEEHELIKESKWYKWQYGNVYKKITEIMAVIQNVNLYEMSSASVRKLNQKSINQAYKMLDELRAEMEREHIKNKQKRRYKWIEKTLKIINIIKTG